MSLELYYSSKAKAYKFQESFQAIYHECIYTYTYMEISTHTIHALTFIFLSLHQR